MVLGFRVSSWGRDRALSFGNYGKGVQSNGETRYRVSGFGFRIEARWEMDVGSGDGREFR
jgi:hypothetical protein